MGKYNLEKMEKKLRKVLDEARYEHTMGVMYTAACLAMRYGEDLERTMVAGLLHDCAKCVPNQEKISLCKKYGIRISEVEMKTPHLLHAKLGARFARDEYGVTDPGILSAITCHTTGKPGMTRLEKIIFLADYIEPGRSKAPDLPQVRKMAFSDLDRAVYMTMKGMLSYLRDKKACLDNQTVVAYNYYKNLMKEKKEEAD